MEGDSAVFTDSVGDAGFSKSDQPAIQQAGDPSRLDTSSAGKLISSFSLFSSFDRQITDQYPAIKNPLHPRRRRA